MIRWLTGAVVLVGLVLAGGPGSAYGLPADFNRGASGGTFGVAAQEEVFSDGFESGDFSVWSGGLEGVGVVEGPGHSGVYWAVFSEGGVWQAWEWDEGDDACWSVPSVSAWIEWTAVGSGMWSLMGLSLEGSYCEMRLVGEDMVVLRAGTLSGDVESDPIELAGGVVWELGYTEEDGGRCTLLRDSEFVAELVGLGSTWCVESLFVRGGGSVGLVGDVYVDDVVMVAEEYIESVGGGWTPADVESALDGLSVLGMLLGIAASCSVASVVALVFLFFRR